MQDERRHPAFFGEKSRTVKELGKKLCQPQSRLSQKKELHFAKLDFAVEKAKNQSLQRFRPVQKTVQTVYNLCEKREKCELLLTAGEKLR